MGGVVNERPFIISIAIYEGDMDSIDDWFEKVCLMFPDDGSVFVSGRFEEESELSLDTSGVRE